MSKDLVRKSDVSKPEQTTKSEQTEVDQATYALAEMMLFGRECGHSLFKIVLVSFSPWTARARWASSSRTEG